MRIGVDDYRSTLVIDLTTVRKSYFGCVEGFPAGCVWQKAVNGKKVVRMGLKSYS